MLFRSNGNANLVSPSKRPIGKDLFKKTFIEKGLKEAVKVAIPRRLFYKIAAIEVIKGKPALVWIYKRIRLLLNSKK